MHEKREESELVEAVELANFYASEKEKVENFGKTPSMGLLTRFYISQREMNYEMAKQTGNNKFKLEGDIFDSLYEDLYPSGETFHFGANNFQ